MLTEVRGTRIPAPIWSENSPSIVLRYYDGPRLLLQRSLTGQLFLAWWRDSDDDTDRWLYLPLSEKRLRAVLSGKITTLEALRNPEDHFLYVVDIDVENDSPIRTIMTTAELLPRDTFLEQDPNSTYPYPKNSSPCHPQLRPITRHDTAEAVAIIVNPPPLIGMAF